ncbi:substrate-binding protein [Sedimenticola selenatireducens]|uniref:ABC transporter substrate-binding protein n=1 Tax=Sedimenticola selenatireducens TaxID=191960 RepID=A0A557RTV6_9GAMM|nr:substrate-binding protein [Sedimenticola selenatireducens]TVO68574.1 ABC transporter substrate-binding protein [Sedimenticola selenatireducens]TVT66510.1 MAG: ABC transporter substrate-binding protein [Sedimenticola selenatireducens]
MTDHSSDKFSTLSRRGFMKFGAASVAAASSPLFFIKDAWAEEKAIGNFPVKGSSVKFGFNYPQSGAYKDEGADEGRAYKLAVEHINSGGGMLSTLQPLALKGNGVLGKKVEFVIGDTSSNPARAVTSARRMIEQDGIIMFSGGSSSSVAIAQQYLAQKTGVIFMCGLTHSNDTTGKDRRRYGFRHFFNAYMSGKALAPVLAKTYGKDRRAFHLTADYSWGHTQYASMKEFTEKQGWTTVNNIMTPLGSNDYSMFLTAIMNSDADVIILNHYGKDMVNSLTQAVEFGMRDLQKNGKNIEFVVPLFSRVMAKGAGASNIDGVFGTTGWNWTLQDAGSQAFVKTFTEKYGFPPSQAAHTCYVQTILYANACEKAGTFYPPEVIKTLENSRYTGIGPGETFYRGEDHQCFKDMLVMKGNGPDSRTGQYDLLKIVEQVKREDTLYDHKTFPGELGPYIPA